MSPTPCHIYFEVIASEGSMTLPQVNTHRFTMKSKNFEISDIATFFIYLAQSTNFFGSLSLTPLLNAIFWRSYFLAFSQSYHPISLEMKATDSWGSDLGYYGKFMGLCGKRNMFELCHGSLSGDLGSAANTQSKLSHRIVMRMK